MTETILTDRQITNNKRTIISLINKIDRPGIDNLLSFLEKSDFYTAPASTRYHEAYAGGLAQHSLHVYNVLNVLYKNMYPEEEYAKMEESIILSGLMHDFAKIGCYETESRNRKNKVTGKWEAYDMYVFKEKHPVAPHGSKSVILLQKFVFLKMHEIMAISWHHGGFNASQAEMSSYMEAVKQSPLVLMLHTADMMAVSGYDHVKAPDACGMSIEAKRIEIKKYFKDGDWVICKDNCVECSEVFTGYCGDVQPFEFLNNFNPKDFRFATETEIEKAKKELLSSEDSEK